MTEHFAHIKIDEPVPTSQHQGGEDTHSCEERGPRTVKQLNALPANPWEEERPRPVVPTEVISSTTLKELCDTLGIPIDSRSGRRRDRELLTTLNYRLYRQGLRMARYIIGKAIPKPDEQLYLYPHEYGEPPKRGTLPPSMFLTAWLVSANGVTQKDLDIIDNWLIKTIGSAEEAIPAMATMRWLTHRKLILTAWRKVRCESLSKFVHRRAALVNLLLMLVTDGPAVSPQRLSRLETIYRLIGLDPADIHSDLHRLSTTGQAAQGANVGKSALSQHRLTEMAADTAKAQAILSQVFDDKPEPSASPTIDKDQNLSKTFEKFREVSKTLDVSDPKSPLIDLLNKLMDRTSWSHADFESLARERRYTPGALLEALNDLAYDTVGDPVAEEDADSILIDIPIAKEIINTR